MERVKSSDVLDVTHEVKAAFEGVVLGSFRRVGPNSWDDYEFVRSTSTRSAAAADSPGSDSIQVESLILVQFEKRGCEVRLRSNGRVQRVRFVPSEADRAALELSLGEPFDARRHARALRHHFELTYLTPNQAEAGLGASAVIVSKLKG